MTKLACPPKMREIAMTLARRGCDHETIVRTMLSWASEASEAAWSRAHEKDAMSDDPGLGLVDAWPKACACGRSYTEHEWRLLQFIGEMVDEETSLKMRNCACGSTIAQEIESV
jgi:hypothetical protein